MCKIMVIPGVTDKNRVLVKKFVSMAPNEMAVGLDRDGFGYAGITKKGDIIGEKWLHPEHAWVRPPKNAVAASTLSGVGKGEELLRSYTQFVSHTKADLRRPNIYTSYGDVHGKSDEVCGLIIHARHATSGGSALENTHPFFELEPGEGVPATAIIHNGTIKNDEKFAAKRYSSCDSEIFLHEYLKRKFYEDNKKFPEFAKELIGEYATAILTMVNGKPVVDVFKAHKQLYIFFIDELDTFVMSTTEFITENICKKLGYTIGARAELDDGKYIRFDALTGMATDKVAMTFIVGEKYVNHSSSNIGSRGYNPQYPYNDRDDRHGDDAGGYWGDFDRSAATHHRPASTSATPTVREIDKAFKTHIMNTRCVSPPKLSSEETTAWLSDNVKYHRTKYKALALVQESLKAKNASLVPAT